MDASKVVANPRISACSTVVFYWLWLFRSTKGKNEDADVQKWLPTLDIGSHINARLHLRPEAGAQRRLEAVKCKPLIMIEASSSTYPQWYAELGQSHSQTRRRPHAIRHQPTPILLWY